MAVTFAESSEMVPRHGAGEVLGVLEERRSLREDGEGASGGDGTENEAYHLVDFEILLAEPAGLVGAVAALAESEAAQGGHEVHEEHENHDHEEEDGHDDTGEHLSSEGLKILAVVDFETTLVRAAVDSRAGNASHGGRELRGGRVETFGKSDFLGIANGCGRLARRGGRRNGSRNVAVSGHRGALAQSLFRLVVDRVHLEQCADLAAPFRGLNLRRHDGGSLRDGHELHLEGGAGAVAQSLGKVCFELRPLSLGSCTVTEESSGILEPDVNLNLLGPFGSGRSRGRRGRDVRGGTRRDICLHLGLTFTDKSVADSHYRR